MAAKSEDVKEKIKEDIKEIEKGRKRQSKDEIEKIEKKVLEGQRIEKTEEEKVEEKIQNEVESVVEEIEPVAEEAEIAKVAETAEIVSPVINPIVSPEELPEVHEIVKSVEAELAEAPRRDIGSWKPKTALGKEVASGAIKNIDEILKSGRKIMEHQIVDMLVPDLKNELLHIGGRKGKGGGKQRIPVKITATMHRSGRRFTYNALAVIGDEKGLIGVGKGSSIETRLSISKAINKAKLSIMRIKIGCGSWECGCGTEHSVPYKTEGKAGSVRVVIMPAPKGVGIVADDETKKVLKIAGIRDAWVKTYGNTGMRINLVSAVFDALKKLYVYER